MVEKISIQIALDGGAEIERQLEGIGEAGQKAFADISKSAEQVGFKNIKPEVVTAKLQEMGVTGVDAIDKIQAAVARAGKLENLVRGVQTVEAALSAMARAAPIAGAAIVTAMTAAAKAAIATAEQINKINEQAIKLGAPIQKVDQFRAALEKAGVSATSIGQILQSKLASEQGVQGLEAFIRQLEQMPDSAARSKLAVQEFGQAGAELIRILQTGGKLTGFKVEGLISAEDAKRATALGVAINQLESSIARLNTLGFAPALTAGINVATGAVDLLGARLQQAPWQTFLTGAQLAFNPIQGLVNTVIAALTAVKPAVDQIGIATQQSSTLFTQWGTVATQSGAAAQQAGQQATGMFTSYGTSVDAATTKTQTFSTSLAGIAWDTISGLGVAAWNALTGAIQAAINKVLEFIGLKPSGPATGSGARGMAGGGLLGGRGTGTSDSNLAWLSRGEYVMPAGAVRRPGVLSFLEALRRSGRIPGFAAGGQVGDMSARIRGIQQPLIQAFDAIDAANKSNLAAMYDIAQSILSAGKSMDQSLLRIQSTMRPIIQALEKLLGAPGRRGGGLLGGRGTGTSDSNLAWVSRGEHIMPARAVQQPGVLAFLEALRRSGGNLSRVLNGMGRFALGGMVPRAIPAYAAGGLAGGGNHVTIQFPGLPAIGGLRASSSVVDQLQKAAALAQVRSGGRKPSRYS